MIVTEKEAKTKICQEAFAGTWREQDGSMLLCRGSLCMSWRWQHHPNDSDKPAGYCGKAGG